MRNTRTASARTKRSVTSQATRVHEHRRKWGAHNASAKSTASKRGNVMIDRRMVLAALAAMTLCSASAQAATDWPKRQVTIMVPTGAGGNTDMMARLAAQHLAAKFGQPFVVESKPGDGGALASGAVVHAAPDGYTIMFTPNSMILLTP